MRLTNDKIYEAIGQAVGDDVIPLVKYLKDRRNISEFKIAEKINEEVNRTRNMLYRLHGCNLVSYHRKKDRQKGWYISYWTFNKRRVKDLILTSKRSEIDKLRGRLEVEESNRNSYFICPNLCARLDFEGAIDFDYKCPECGALLKHQDNSKTIEHIRQRIKKLEARA
ncbi:hypothetical protein A3K72_03440 [Candidatus Woesearchaeota archaeon RBG_13_36_6]|nr:MAG: hypothetical protein A3K72_03440 [Candidatus Woesearchaeota archaeon RBG_13_36_6]